MMNFHKKSHEVPGLNTSSLPDLIFSVLFFFMIVTHMRQVTLKVDCRLPQGKELTRLTKKSAVSHIYIGKPTKEMQAKYGTGTQIQLNDKFASAPEVMDYISAEKKRTKFIKTCDCCMTVTFLYTFSNVINIFWT